MSDRSAQKNNGAGALKKISEVLDQEEAHSPQAPGLKKLGNIKSKNHEFGVLGIDYKRMNQVVDDRKSGSRRSHSGLNKVDSFSNLDESSLHSKIDGYKSNNEHTIKKKKSHSDPNIKFNAEDEKQKIFMDEIINKYSKKREKADSAPVKDEPKDSKDSNFNEKGGEDAQ